MTECAVRQLVTHTTLLLSHPQSDPEHSLTYQLCGFMSYTSVHIQTLPSALSQHSHHLIIATQSVACTHNWICSLKLSACLGLTCLFLKLLQLTH